MTRTGSPGRIVFRSLSCVGRWTASVLFFVVLQECRHDRRQTSIFSFGYRRWRFRVDPCSQHHRRNNNGVDNYWWRERLYRVK
ncbi:hypothetical protein BGY98DRAFT_483246 [Russula aff. rugulosa BPL654]|nr:hypothetical protein BGY98DRAFT_483246 [Russula aff. rugulosa BPL654]